MKDQVTSIEQSNRLLNLGVPAEKASMVWRKYIYQHFDRDVIDEVKYELDLAESRQRDPDESDIPAYTVADLLGIMPKDIGCDRSLCLYIEGTAWIIEWVDGDFCEGRAANANIIALLCDRIEWLVSNGYKLEFPQKDKA